MDLNCRFKDGGRKGKRLIVYTCYGKTSDITEPSTKIKAIIGAHQNGKNNEDVEGLMLTSTTVNFIPRGLNVFFPNVTHLNVSDCGLKSICRRDLSQFPKLEVLWLNSNELTSLPDDLFEDTKNLKAISFCNNKIEFMSSNLFKPIIGNKIKTINFRKNTGIKTIYSPGVNGTVASVTDLMRIIDAKCSRPPTSQHEIALDLLTTHREISSTVVGALFISAKFSDFSIIVNDSKIFKVHRCILAAHSQGFAEMFDQDPDAVEMKIEDLSAEAVEIFLRFLYTGRLDYFEDKSLELFALASRLKVPDLRESMLELVMSQLDESNAFKAFSVAHSTESDKLKRAAFEAIKKMFPDRKLPESLMENLKKVKKMIAGKEKFDAMMKEMEKF
jgi:hypothetical protein